MTKKQTPTLSHWWDKLSHYEDLMRLNRPIGILLLWWPTFTALILASHGNPPFTLIWIFALGTILMRSAGCILNDLADRNFDPYVERTRNRPLARGVVSIKEAVILAIFLIFCSFLLVCFALTSQAMIWAVAGFLITWAYPYMKRFIALPQAILGIAFSIGIPIAYIEIIGQTHWSAWALIAANISWAMAYDTIYAMADRADDIKLEVKSSAIVFGEKSPLWVAGFHLFTLLIYLIMGIYLDAHLLYYISLCIAAVIAFALYRMISAQEPRLCLKAFQLSHWFGAAICLGMLAQYWLPNLIHST